MELRSIETTTLRNGWVMKPTRKAVDGFCCQNIRSRSRMLLLPYAMSHTSITTNLIFHFTLSNTSIISLHSELFTQNIAFSQRTNMLIVIDKLSFLSCPGRIDSHHLETKVPWGIDSWPHPLIHWRDPSGPKMPGHRKLWLRTMRDIHGQFIRRTSWYHDIRKIAAQITRILTMYETIHLEVHHYLNSYELSICKWFL